MDTVEQTACILCPRNCGLQIELAQGVVAGVRGDPAHPVSRGYLCQKASRLAHYQQGPDRLEHPLRRQPDGTFVRVGWDEALAAIARQLVAVRERHGGRAFAMYGGGGLGNHLGYAYSRQLHAAMRSPFTYNALAQEKTGDIWLNGRLFGDQRCHLTEDVEHADFVLILGTNPVQSHGIPNARQTLRALHADPARTLVVVDPRRTETARLAGEHLQVRPGTDAFLLAAMLALIVREGLHDREFLATRCTGFAAVEAALAAVPVEDFVRRADVPLAQVERVARGFARARTACVRVDLGLQHSLHSTLNSYLEKLLFLLTGNFGKRGGNNFHTFFLPVLSHTDERDPRHLRTAHQGMFPIGGIYPPSILPSEIDHPGEDRVRAVVVDSANPLLTGADTAAFERAFSRLELLVVVDVAMTETARLAHWVLPAATQLEKWECTGFNLEFPDNAFQLRHPLLPPRPEALPEAELYTRLLVAMGALPADFPALRWVAAREAGRAQHAGYLAALGATFAARPWLWPYAASIVYRTLGPTLRSGRARPDRLPPAAAAPLLWLALQYANREPEAVRRAGHRGNRLTSAVSLFRSILERGEGTLVSRHAFEDTWRFLRHPHRRIDLAVPEMLEALGALREEPPQGPGLVLAAGERRAYNANQVIRHPAWRKADLEGALRMHPADARARGLEAGARALCTSATGALEVTVELDEGLRPGMVALPHGHGMRHGDAPPAGPQLNRLTAATHCDPIARTPYHKHVLVEVCAAARGAEATAAPPAAAAPAARPSRPPR